MIKSSKIHSRWLANTSKMHSLNFAMRNQECYEKATQAFWVRHLHLERDDLQCPRRSQCINHRSSVSDSILDISWSQHPLLTMMQTNKNQINYIIFFNLFFVFKNKKINRFVSVLCTKLKFLHHLKGIYVLIIFIDFFVDIIQLIYQLSYLMSVLIYLDLIRHS